MVSETIAYSQFQRYHRLAQIGVLLAGEQHLPKLYDLVVCEAMGLTNAQAGVLFIREGDILKPAAYRADLPLDAGTLETFLASEFSARGESLCGEVLQQNKILNLADVHTLPEGRPAILWPELVSFHSRELHSLLALPLITPQSGHLGILALLNARASDGEVGPFDPEIGDLMKAVASQAALAVQNVRWSRQLHQAYQDTLYRLSLVAKYREDPSGSQIRRVSQYSGILAGALGLPEEQVELIKVSSSLYDIGKLGIPEAILLKPGRLTPDEFERMKQHTTLGSVILGGSKTDVLQMAERIALTHHEKFDGSGYPSGQAGMEIPIEGRIVALAEVFDALTTSRPYKTPMTFEQAIETLCKESGKHFDPDIIQAFLKVMTRFQEILQTVKP